MTDYIHKSGNLTSRDGKQLFYQAWLSPESKGTVVIAHGIGEHSGRYNNLLEAVKDIGISVYSLDHRGHGRSEGKRGHIMSFAEYVDDFDLLVQTAKDENTALPVIILGHSLGGVIAFHYVLKYGQNFAGLVLSSAGFKSKVEVSPLKEKVALILSKVAPAFTMSTGLDSGMLSHDPEVVRAYINDPLVYDQVSGRWYTEFLAAGQQCLERAEELTLPLLIIQGKADGIVDCRGSEEVMEKASSTDKEIHLFDDLYHETMNETASERNKVLTVIRTWIEQHL